MTINKEFEQAVLGQDLLMVRIMLKDALIVDPTHVSFSQRLAYAESRLGDLYDDHDGELLQQASELWAEDYLDEQMVKVVHNFSRERLALLRAMTRQLYGGMVVRQHSRPAPAPAPAPRNYGTAASGSQAGASRRATYVPNVPSYRGGRSKRQLGAGLAVAGVGVLILGAAIPKTVLTVAGIALAVVGGGLILMDKPRRFL